MNCGLRRPGKGNDMLEIKIDGSIASGNMSGDFETLIDDTRSVLTTIYTAIEERCTENDEDLEKARNIWCWMVLMHIATIKEDKVEKLYGSCTEFSDKEAAERAIKDIPKMREIFKGSLKDLF